MSKAEQIGAKPCLFNCVLYCEQPERMQYLLDFVQTVATYFPCRLFCIQHRADLPPGSYEQKCKQTEKWSSFSDVLFVESSTDNLYRIPFSLFPFLAPELPIVLFWDADPTQEEHVLPRILPYAERCIFDSETVGDLPLFAARMLNTPKEETRKSDLNWARLFGWRDIFAKVFDTEERLQHLQKSAQVHLQYNARENRFFHHSQTQALYLQAWLSSKMGWSYEGIEKTSQQLVLLYRSEKEKVRVVIEPVYMEQRAPGALLVVDVISHLGTEVTIDSRALFGLVRVKSICDASCTLPYNIPLKGSRLTSGFIEQLLFGQVDGDYTAMLQKLSQITMNAYD